MNETLELTVNGKLEEIVESLRRFRNGMLELIRDYI